MSGGEGGDGSRDPRLHPDQEPVREARQEIRFHLEERAREFEMQGMTPEEARRAAHRAFGDAAAVEAEVRRIDRQRDRDGMGRRMMSSMVQDLRYGVRGLRKHPTLSSVVVLTLGLGIGAVTAVFSVVDASLLRALPFADADGLVFLQGAFDAPEGPQVRFASPPEARDWAAMSRSFSGVAVADGTGMDLSADGSTERVPVERVDKGYFDIMGVEPVLGRRFTPEEYRSSGDLPVVVLGHGLWIRRFGGDRSVLGRSVVLDGRTFTVVGVAPPDFAGTTLQSELWVPLAMIGPEALQDRGSRYLNVVARLAPGVSLEAARQDMASVAARLQETHPEVNENRIALVMPLREAYLGDTRILMLVILGAAALLLTVASANVVNLLLVRATGRGGEVLMRRALGAGRGRLLGQFVTEGLVLSAVGAALGLALGVWGAEILSAAMPATLLPAFVDVRPRVSVFLLTAALMTAVGVAAGVVPGIAAARKDVAGGLREESPGTARRGRAQSALVVGEVALALLLLVGAGLMTRSLRSQLAVEPGYDPTSLYAFRVDFPAERYPGDALPAAARDLAERLEARPEIAVATLGSDVPLRGGFSAAFLWRDDAMERDDRIRFYVHRVGPGWFETLGTAVLRGRTLDEAGAMGGTGAPRTAAGTTGGSGATAGTTGGTGATASTGTAGTDADGPASTADPAVISRAMAARFFPGEDPLGRTLVVGGPNGPTFTVVGVAEDVRYRDLTSDITGGADDPDVYLPWVRVPSRSVTFALRSPPGSPVAMDAVVRQVVSGFDPDMTVYGHGPMADDLRAQTDQARFGSLLLTSFSLLAAFLALVGLYGVLSFDVGRRRREIALRMALGAEAERVRGMVVASGMKLVLAGLVLGLGTAVLASRSLTAFLFGVEPVDAPTYAAVAAAMAVVALGATWIPALRATRVDPQAALKAQ